MALKLEKNLENLVRSAIGSRGLKEQSEQAVSTDVRRNAYNLFSQTEGAGITNGLTLPVIRAGSELDVQDTIEIGYNQIYKTLQASIDDKTYKDSKDSFMKDADEKKKLQFYMNMLEQDILPAEPAKDAKPEEKEAYKKLMVAKEELETAKSIGKALSKGDTNTAYAIVRETFDVEANLLAVIPRGYGGPAFRDSETKVYAAIANRRASEAIKTIKENKLYSLIDQGIKENELGKAHALNAMYALSQK
jgi:hypothetical protein